MGYRIEADTINIRHPAHQGLLVVARSVPLGRLMEIQRAAAELDESDRDAVHKFTQETLGEFVASVVEWNLERADGTPVPVTVDDLLAVPSAQLPFQLVRAWQEGLAAVDAPLLKASTSGASLPAVPIPMVPLSSDRAS